MWKRIESKNVVGFRFFIFENVLYSDEFNKICKFFYYFFSCKVVVLIFVFNNNLFSV